MEKIKKQANIRFYEYPIAFIMILCLLLPWLIESFYLFCFKIKERTKKIFKRR